LALQEMHIYTGYSQVICCCFLFNIFERKIYTVTDYQKSSWF